jgi:hypothetical protein
LLKGEGSLEKIGGEGGEEGRKIDREKYGEGEGGDGRRERRTKRKRGG